MIAGTTLEEHLRQLCQKNHLDVTVTKPNGSTEPKKASVMNDDMRKQLVFPQPDWRLNSGWLDIRNDCAHRPVTTYTKEQIQQMIDGIRGFMARHPA